jgi:hypothetical protein
MTDLQAPRTAESSRLGEGTFTNDKFCQLYASCIAISATKGQHQVHVSMEWNQNPFWNAQ